MSNILIIDGHQPWPFAPGRLNSTLTKIARDTVTSMGHEAHITTVSDGWDTEEEIARHQWADVIIYQFPVNSMSVPWVLKKYIDEIGAHGLDGRLAVSDGRSAEAPDKNYGMGGRMQDTSYMLSVTFNAPEGAFNTASEAFFAGGSVDDLLRPVHLNAKFYGMRPLSTFAAFDVVKNPDIEADFDRFRAHIRQQIAPSKVIA